MKLITKYIYNKPYKGTSETVPLRYQKLVSAIETVGRDLKILAAPVRVPDHAEVASAVEKIDQNLKISAAPVQMPDNAPDVRRSGRLQGQDGSKTTADFQTAESRKRKVAKGQNLSIFDQKSDEESELSPIEEITVNAKEQATTQKKTRNDGGELQSNDWRTLLSILYTH